MNKQQFFRELNNYLRRLPKDELNDILYDYEEHFINGMQNGRSEENICQKLGSPKSIAVAIKADFYIENAEKTTSARNTISAVFAATALGFFNIIFVLGPFLGVVGLMIALWATAFSFTLSGFLGALGYSLSIIFPFLKMFISIPFGLSFFTLFFSTISIGIIGLFMGIGCYHLSKWFSRMILKYLKWNIIYITRRRKI